MVLVKAGAKHAWVHDPALGRRKLSLDEVSRHFTGVALELKPTPGFQLKAPAPRVKIWDLWRGAEGLNANLASVFALSILLQVTLIAAPLQVQWVIDQGVAHTDRELVTLLALGFLCVLAIQLAAQMLRGWLIVRLTHLVAFEFARNLFAHMLRLPLEWFEKRHLGDLTSRFGSLGPVKDALTQGLVTICVDGFMALAMMLGYDASLGAIVLGACALYMLARLVQLPTLMRTSMDEIHAGAKAETSFLESMRSMPAVRAYSQERGRMDLWQNHEAQTLNAGIRLAQVVSGRRRRPGPDLRRGDHCRHLLGRHPHTGRGALHRHALRLSQLQGQLYRPLRRPNRPSSGTAPAACPLGAAVRPLFRGSRTFHKDNRHPTRLRET